MVARTPPAALNCRCALAPTTRVDACPRGRISGQALGTYNAYLVPPLCYVAAMASGDAHQSLRLRRKGSHDADTTPPAQDEVRPRKTEEVVWGKTPSGQGWSMGRV